MNNSSRSNPLNSPDAAALLKDKSALKKLLAAGPFFSARFDISAVLTIIGYIEPPRALTSRQQGGSVRWSWN